MTDKRDEAYKDYLNDMKYADIAKKYSVTVSAVKSWATRYWKKEKVATEEKKLQPPPRTKGGANNEKHGAYSGFFADVLTAEEIAVMGESEPDVKAKLIEELHILTIREKRLLIQIAKYQGNYKFDDEDINVMTGVMKIARERDGKKEKEVIKDTAAAYLYLKVLEEQLTKVQAAKIKCAAELTDITKDEKPNDGDGIIINFSGENELED